MLTDRTPLVAPVAYFCRSPSKNRGRIVVTVGNYPSSPVKQICRNAQSINNVCKIIKRRNSTSHLELFNSFLVTNNTI